MDRKTLFAAAAVASLAAANSASAAMALVIGDVIPSVNGTSGGGFTTVTFPMEMTQAPVVVPLATNEGVDSGALRIQNVTTTGFEIVVAEPRNFDGSHAAMTNVGYLAVVPDRSITVGGTTFYAGIHQTSTTIQNAAVFGSAGGTDPVAFPGGVFPGVPTLLSAVQTTNNETATLPNAPSDPWLQASVSSLTALGFNTALERAEVNSGSVTADESIGWIGIGQGSNGILDNSDGNQVLIDSFISPDTIDGWDNGGASIGFGQSFGSAPITVASLVRRDGADGGWLRRGSVGAGSITLLVDEDTFSDPERGHTTEAAGIFAFSEPFVLIPEPSRALLLALGLLGAAAVRRRRA